MLRVPQEPGISPFFSGDGAKPYIHMNGQETFRFAVNSMTADITKVLDDAGLTMDDIALVIPHQANYRIIKFAAEKLGVPEEKFFVNIAEYGNTSSASIPDRALRGSAKRSRTQGRPRDLLRIRRRACLCRLHSKAVKSAERQEIYI